MEIIENKEYGGERPLFAAHDLKLVGVTFNEGESALKRCRNIDAENCVFRGKYPFWHVKGFSVDHCIFEPGARAALWYSDNCVMRNTIVNAPKDVPRDGRRDPRPRRHSRRAGNALALPQYRHQGRDDRQGRLHLYALREYPHRPLSTERQLFVPVCAQCRNPQCRNQFERRLLGDRECDGARQRTAWRVPRLAFAPTAPNQLPHIRHPAPVLLRGTCARKLHLRPRLRPRLRGVRGRGNRQVAYYQRQKSHHGLNQGPVDRRDYHRRKYSGPGRLPHRDQ